MKLLIMKFSPLSCNSIRLGFKYATNHSVLMHPQPAHSFNASGQISDLKKTTCKVIVSYRIF
jgi:hypothetical protein